MLDSVKGNEIEKYKKRNKEKGSDRSSGNDKERDKRKGRDKKTGRDKGSEEMTSAAIKNVDSNKLKS